MEYYKRSISGGYEYYILDEVNEKIWKTTALADGSDAGFNMNISYVDWNYASTIRTYTEISSNEYNKETSATSGWVQRFGSRPSSH